MYKITVDVEGMMCGHCEAHVNETVRKNFDVKDVTSSHSKGKTEIISEAELDEAKLKDVIEAEEYKVLGIKSEPYEKKGFSLFNK